MHDLDPSRFPLAADRFSAAWALRLALPGASQPRTSLRLSMGHLPAVASPETRALITKRPPLVAPCGSRQSGQRITVLSITPLSAPKRMLSQDGHTPPDGSCGGIGRPYAPAAQRHGRRNTALNTDGVLCFYAGPPLPENTAQAFAFGRLGRYKTKRARQPMAAIPHGPSGTITRRQPCALHDAGAFGGAITDSKREDGA